MSKQEAFCSSENFSHLRKEQPWNFLGVTSLFSVLYLSIKAGLRSASPRHSLPFLRKRSVSLDSGLGNGMTVLIFAVLQVIRELALSEVRD